jgi:hypothetical protein
MLLLSEISKIKKSIVDANRCLGKMDLICYFGNCGLAYSLHDKRLHSIAAEIVPNIEMCVLKLEDKLKELENYEPYVKLKQEMTENQKALDEYTRKYLEREIPERTVGDKQWNKNFYVGRHKYIQGLLKLDRIHSIQLKINALQSPKGDDLSEIHEREPVTDCF